MLGGGASDLGWFRWRAVASARPLGATAHSRGHGSGIGRWGRSLPESGGSGRTTAYC
jgi:hypothetical protein